MELGIEVLCPALVDVPKKQGAKPLSRSGSNVRRAICEQYSTPRLRDPVQLLRASIVFTDPLFDKHEAPGSVSYNPTKIQWPTSCSVREPIRLSMNMRIVQSSSCVEGKPAVKPCSDRPSPSYVLSRPCASLTQMQPTKQTTSSLLSDVTPNNRYTSGAWLARTKPGKARLLPARHAWLACYYRCSYYKHSLLPGWLVNAKTWE